ncbi:MAG: phosphoadenylyl-sulfate reductase [Mariprofundales bacterium]
MLNDKIKNSLALVRQAIAKHARFCCYPTSLGAEASVLIDLICRNNLDIAIITPDLSDVQQLIAEYGDDLYRKSIELRKACCHVRKVEPLTKTLVGKAWITGRRREQSKDRQKLAFIEKSPSIGIEKYNPLLAWTYKEIWEYIRMFDVPYNALFDCHYRSIGCYPCTRAIAVGEDERAGRWWWELDDAASECGLHMSPINQNNKVKSLKNNPWKGKRILITGVCGTVGKELLRQVVKQEPYEIIGIDNNETELFFVDEDYKNNTNVHVYLGDLRDKDKLMRKMQGVDIVLHAAALKHVVLCEKTPRDAVLTNILGMQNIIDSAVANNVGRVLFTSSDKAVNPTNVMGTTKLMGERLITAANAHRRKRDPIFASTRFGNVLGSRGSVIPIFKKQILIGGPVTLTEPDMTRFIMTVSDAVKLVMDSVFLACGGEVFVTKMPIARIQDLAEVMIEELAANPEQVIIKIIGCKPGEKLYEELMSDEETRRTVELPDYFSVLPAFKSVYERISYTYPEMGEVGVDDPYNSSTQPAMNKEELRIYLKKNKLLEGEV